MRDAFGGTFMIQILLVFIIIYVGFLGIAINYGKAFRVKNSVIDYLEEHEINSLEQSNMYDKLNSDLSSILNNFGYKNNDYCSTNDDTPTRKCINGVVIELNGNIDKNGVKHVYYTVNTYYGFSLGFLNSLLSLTRESSGKVSKGLFTISGETKVIVTS